MKRKQKEEEDKTLEILKMIRDEYSDFQGLSDNEKKINSLMDFSFGVFLYSLRKNDYQNYVRLFGEDTKTQEDK